MHTMDVYSYWMIATFVIGYFFITIEHYTKINKATIALLMGVICWFFQFINETTPCRGNMACLGGHVFNISQIVFFLLGAMTIVEIVNAHNGFNFISQSIHVRSKRKFLWIIGLISFFLSGILDNLTTTVVMVVLVRNLVANVQDRWIIGGGAVIAANAGGAWTPIGDVTTTMLWIGGQLSTLPILKDLFFPSATCMIVSLSFLSFMLRGDLEKKEVFIPENGNGEGKLFFFLGIIALVSVPILKIATGLPPFMGMLLALGVLWLVTDLINARHENRAHLLVSKILSQIDLSGVLFFLGILLAVNALESAEILGNLAAWLGQKIESEVALASSTGLASAVVDNVPLVAATMGMYSLTQYPTDSSFWELIAYCAGTGGSILLIGSAAGVVFMGLEKVDFFWYLRWITLPALLGYFAGIIIYMIF